MSAEYPFKVVVTHGGRFHADDVCAVAFLRILGAIDDSTQLIRTLEEDPIAKADIVLDVGRVYDPANNRFDHHQADFEEQRECGVPYATFGLVVKKFGPHALDLQELSEFDKRFVRLIDGPDCGHLLHKGETVTLPLAISWFMPDWDDEDDDSDAYDQAFDEAVSWTIPLMRNAMRRAKSKVRANRELGQSMSFNPENGVIEMWKFVPWVEYVCEHYPDALYVIYPHTRGGWAAQVVPEHPQTFDSKARFPKEWGGRVNEELAEVSGVESARFCHANGFLAVANTLEDIRLMVTKSLEKAKTD